METFYFNTRFHPCLYMRKPLDLTVEIKFGILFNFDRNSLNLPTLLLKLQRLRVRNMRL